MLLIVFTTFLITTGIYGVLLWLGLQRVVRHLKNNPEGVRAVCDHVLLPALGREKPESESEEPAKKVEVKEKKKGLLL